MFRLGRFRGTPELHDKLRDAILHFSMKLLEVSHLKEDFQMYEERCKDDG